jgi:hypothetical protein
MAKASKRNGTAERLEVAEAVAALRALSKLEG